VGEETPSARPDVELSAPGVAGHPSCCSSLVGENAPRTRRSQAGPQRSSRRPHCEREMTARPTSGYQTGAPALLRVAQDAVKEDKGWDPAIARRRALATRGAPGPGLGYSTDVGVNGGMRRV
jgi:hypothetical protein